MHIHTFSYIFIHIHTYTYTPTLSYRANELFRAEKLGYLGIPKSIEMVMVSLLQGFRRLYLYDVGVLFHIEWYITKPALIFFYHIL